MRIQRDSTVLLLLLHKGPVVRKAYNPYILPVLPLGPCRAHPCSHVELTESPLCDTIAKLSQLPAAWGGRGCQLPRQLTNSTSFRERRKIRAVVINPARAQQEVAVVKTC